MSDSLEGEFETALATAIDSVGREQVLAALSHLAQRSDIDRVLTIVVNAGVHHLPPEYHRGEVFVASEGTLNLSSAESIHAEFRRILLRTAGMLKSRAWQRVYIIPFGPTALSMLLKLLVYRVCAIESIDVVNVPGNRRVDLSFDLRQIIIDSGGMEWEDVNGNLK